MNAFGPMKRRRRRPLNPKGMKVMLIVEHPANLRASSYPSLHATGTVTSGWHRTQHYGSGGARRGLVVEVRWDKYGGVWEKRFKELHFFES